MSFINLLVDEGLFGEKDPFIQNEDDYSIAEIIPKILQKRSFLDLTETSLKEPEVVEEKEELKDEKINELKNELTKNINLALNETSLSLDLVSLLLSSSKPNLSKATISPFLSKTVPLGSLNSNKLHNTQEHTEDNSLIGQGWRHESINKIQKLLKDKSMELKQSFEKDKKYWSMINEIINNNEILIKLRDPVNNQKAIGVKYGYGDSGSNYSDKGIAVLRRDETGGILFHPLINKDHKFVRVKILTKKDNDFVITGESTFKNKFSDDLTGQIEMSRFFIFEDDLFYNLLREARVLISYNVQLVSNKILIDIGDELIEIESVNYDKEDTDDMEVELETKENDHKCDLILNFLKIMLCGYYKYNLNLKQKIPTNFTKFKQNNSHPLLLRALLGTINHELNFKKITTIINDKIESYKMGQLEVKKFDNINDTSNAFIKSIEKPVSTFELVLNNKGKYLKISLSLTCGEILVNLIVKVNIIRFDNYEDMKSNENGGNVLMLVFNDIDEVDQCLDWSIKNFVE
ncbi:mediator of RNA polymerase II transcription subunit 17 [[Candida] jaroonii]|uniref:Mediator of RNA polymerase II transcription subunit 17 n=1 Tax=[Candida] jaroonii TaxID=467808 RepID=A0ACA9Y5C8_9ASCO|nr:mediator of RNA polymerase II transcription subunit 17 [[Candida] jaroonii]